MAGVMYFMLDEEEKEEEVEDALWGKKAHLDEFWRGCPGRGDGGGIAGAQTAHITRARR